MNYLNPPGFLGTGASLLADVTLLAYILLLVPGMLIGYYYARINKHRPQHRNLMVGITVINWILIFWLMIVAFSYDVGPNIGSQPGNARYLTPSVHAALGAVAQILATYVIFRMYREDMQVAAAKKRGEFDTSRYWFTSAKITMRIVLGLWLLVSALGVLSYLVRYDVLKLGGGATEVPIVATEEPLATAEVSATDEVAVTDEASGAAGATLVITSGDTAATEEPSQPVVTEEAAAPTEAAVAVTEEVLSAAAPTEVALLVETEEPTAPTDAPVVETEEVASVAATEEVALVVTETSTDVEVAETEEPAAAVASEEPVAPTEIAVVETEEPASTETPTDVEVAETEEPAATVAETQEVAVTPTSTSRSPSIIATVSALSVVVTPEVAPVAETQEVAVAQTQEAAPPSATPRPTATRPAPTPAPAVAGEPLVEIATNARLGQILVDPEGRTLYVYANDEPGWSNCVGRCLTNWEIYEVEEDTPLVLGEGLDGELGLVARADGTYQVWYNDQPLYYFKLDRRAGDARGNGADRLWSVVEVP